MTKIVRPINYAVPWIEENCKKKACVVQILQFYFKKTTPGPRATTGVACYLYLVLLIDTAADQRWKIIDKWRNKISELLSVRTTDRNEEGFDKFVFHDQSISELCTLIGRHPMHGEKRYSQPNIFALYTALKTEWKYLLGIYLKGSMVLPSSKSLKFCSVVVSCCCNIML